MVQSQQVFKQIRDLVQAGHSARMQIAMDGKSCIREFSAPQRLILLGGGHISMALCHFASQLEFDVVVVDDRPVFANSRLFPTAKQIVCNEFRQAIRDLKITDNDFVCVVTRGHRYDGDCLREIFAGTYPLYLGMIGSKKRVYQLFQLLNSEGFDKSLTDRVCSPIGLKIGAITPQEIAISILAELIDYRSRAAKAAASQNILTQKNVDMDLLNYLADSPEQKAIAIVLESRGSTPVASGSVMAVNPLGQTHGTIGGGCSEGAVIRDAIKIAKNGGSKIIYVDMTNDVAESEGMVCGGVMWVLVDQIVND